MGICHWEKSNKWAFSHEFLLTVIMECDPQTRYQVIEMLIWVMIGVSKNVQMNSLDKWDSIRFEEVLERPSYLSHIEKYIVLDHPQMARKYLITWDNVFEAVFDLRLCFVKVCCWKPRWISCSWRDMVGRKESIHVNYRPSVHIPNDSLSESWNLSLGVMKNVFKVPNFKLYSIFNIINSLTCM